MAISSKKIYLQTSIHLSENLFFSFSESCITAGRIRVNPFFALSVQNLNLNSNKLLKVANLL